MTETTEHNGHLRDHLDELQRMRDELRLKLHLAGMSAKKTFTELENKFENIEKRVASEGDRALHASALLINHLRQAFSNFRSELRAK